jgi:hypothetical protein
MNCWQKLLARILPMAGAPWLIALLAPVALLAQANPLPPPPVPAPSLAPSPLSSPVSLPVSSPANLDLGGAHRGGRLAINALEQRARWLWLGDGSSPAELWLPLEVLQNQLGVSSVSRGGGQLELQWFGRSLPLPPQRQRSLDDEVAVEVAGLLSDVGVAVRRDGERLSLTLPPPPLLGLRLGNAGRRLVLDLAAPAALRSDPSGLLVGVRARPDQLAELQGLGLEAALEANGLGLANGLRLAGGSIATARVFTLGGPSRVVIDLSSPAGTSAGTSAAAGANEPPQRLDPRLQALLGQELRWQRLVRSGVRINAVQLDPRHSSLQLRLLTGDRGMEGLNSLLRLAQNQDALVAINGGFFNRVRRLPLGAIKQDGRWLSGPILNRGVIAWQSGELPRFGRLRLEEWAEGAGERIPLQVLNSGYVQRGVSRYTADWGPSYRALSDNETGLLLRSGRVLARLEAPQLALGVPLAEGDSLLVARAGANLPWNGGEAVEIASLSSEPLLGLAPSVLGGGPLLLEQGRLVLNGTAEGFSSAFLSQGAPRTVVASDGTRLWLITLEGSADAGPTLAHTAQLLLQLGLRDALNLDGGSSTGLVMGGTMPVMGRGVVGAVHHGLGLVP